jgi:hypothetical protein
MLSGNSELAIPSITASVSEELTAGQVKLLRKIHGEIEEKLNSAREMVVYGIRTRHKGTENMYTYEMEGLRSALNIVSAYIGGAVKRNEKKPAKKLRFRRDQVYLLELMPSGGFVLLNRYYKPLGMIRAPRHVGYVDYFKCPTVKLDLETVKRTAVCDSEDTFSKNRGCHCYWLYQDLAGPTRSAGNMRAYERRLSALGLEIQ